MDNILDGRKVSEELDKEYIKKINTLNQYNLQPCLVVILIGNKPESLTYVSMKKKKMIELETLLKSHDWLYFYSDDSRSYRKGDEEHSKIRRLVDFIGKDGKKLYKSYGKQRGVM